mgnify:CR=1 FL=1
MMWRRACGTHAPAIHGRRGELWHGVARHGVVRQGQARQANNVARVKRINRGRYGRQTWCSGGAQAESGARA